MKIKEFSASLNPPTPLSKGGVLLALGAESAGSFAIYYGNSSFLWKQESRKNHERRNLWIPAYAGMTDVNILKKLNIYLSPNFGDLLDDNNFLKFQKAVLDFLKINKIKPNTILTDLHPLYKTTLWGAELAKKYKAEHTQVQHHLAHIFSAIEDKQIHNTLYKIPDTFYGIALDGTGYGLDGKIWGGEIFKITPLIKGTGGIVRIGHLENQIMIGGDLAVKEPARMLISIMDKFSNNFQLPIFKTKKDFIFHFVKKYYTRNQFELLYNQLQNNFNCIETSSTGRILDAVSVLLGFAKNKRSYKHEATDLLEKNSAKPYKDLKPKITFNFQLSTFNLLATPLFEYLIKNLHKDKKRLAATAQIYIAEGLYKIIKKNNHNKKNFIHNIFVSGGISNNKIISSYLESKGVIANKKIPRGDAGISFGQIIYYLNSKNKSSAKLAELLLIKQIA